MPPRRSARKRLLELKGSYRYGLVLALALLSTGVEMLLSDTSASWLLQSMLMVATVATALFASGATRRHWQEMGLLLSVAALVLIGAAFSGTSNGGRGVMFSVSGLMAAGGAVIVGRGVVRGIGVEQRVTLHSVMGALTVYLLAGLVFAFSYGVMDAIAGSPVLSNIASGEKHAQEVYFSFITLTTVGFGDIAPVAKAARMTSVLEALFGQLYLVTIVAVIVSNVVPGRRVRRGARGAEAGAESGTAGAD